MKTLRHQSGLSIIEVFISLVILSVGILGVVGTQLMSLREEQYAYIATLTAQQTQNAAEEKILQSGRR